MINFNRRFLMIFLLLITSIIFIGCSKVPNDLASKIEDEIKKSNPDNLRDSFHLGLVMLFDSDNKETRFFARELTFEKDSQRDNKLENENDAQRDKETGKNGGYSIISSNVLENEKAVAIREISLSSILGLSEVVTNDGVYKSCQYLAVNNHKGDEKGNDLSRLICPHSENREKELSHLATNEMLDKEIVKKLREFSGIEKIKFVVFNDYKNGGTEFFLASSDYFSLKIDFPLTLTKDPENNPQKITNWNNWSVITYRQNPCKQCRQEGGKTVCEYFKDKSNCS